MERVFRNEAEQTEMKVEIVFFVIWCAAGSSPEIEVVQKWQHCINRSVTQKRPRRHKRPDRPMLERFGKKWIMTDVGRVAVAQLRYFETRFPASNTTY